MQCLLSGKISNVSAAIFADKIVFLRALRTRFFAAFCANAVVVVGNFSVATRALHIRRSPPQLLLPFCVQKRPWKIVFSFWAKLCFGRRPLHKLLDVATGKKGELSNQVQRLEKTVEKIFLFLAGQYLLWFGVDQRQKFLRRFFRPPLLRQTIFSGAFERTIHQSKKAPPRRSPLQKFKAAKNGLSSGFQKKATVLQKKSKANLRCRKNLQTQKRRSNGRLRSCGFFGKTAKKQKKSSRSFSG